MNCSQFCLICGIDMRLDGGLSMLFYCDDVICPYCRSQLQKYPKRIVLDDLVVYGLYPYQNLLRNTLLSYKEYRDEALFPIFLYQEIKRLSRKYKDYVIVCAPSSKHNNEKRGFKHVEKMFSILNLPIVDCLEKTKDIEQKSNNYLKRKEIKEYIICKDLENIRGKKVLLVDDILTSSQTMRTCYDLLKGNCKKITCMVISYNKAYLNVLERRIVDFV